MDPCFNGRPAFTLIATITELKTQFYEKRSMSELNQKVNFFVHFFMMMIMTVTRPFLVRNGPWQEH